MGGAESVIPKEHSSGNKVLDISRHVSHKAFLKHSQGEINYNCLTEFPWDLRDSITLYERIDASFNHIGEIPEEIPLRIPHLTQLILSYNKISSLPETFMLFFHMQELCLDHNDLETVPKSLTKLVTLEKLDLSDNFLRELPEDIDELKSLQRLNLRNNRLQTLPVSLAMCPLKAILVQNNLLQKPLQQVCDRGSRSTIEALRSMCTHITATPMNDVLEFPRVRAAHLMISSNNPSAMHLEFSQLQIFPDKVKTPLIPPSGSTSLEVADLRDKIAGLIYGAAIGDALALATENLTRDECSFYYNPTNIIYDDIIRDEHRTHWRKGDWSTSFDQMVLVIDSIIQWGGVVDELEFAKQLSAWCKNGFPELGDKKGLYFSETIAKVCSDKEFQSDPHRVAASIDLVYNDDHALVRALITGIPHFHNIEEVMANSTRICKTTHAAAACVASSALLSGLVALILQGNVQVSEASNLVKESFGVAQQYLPCQRDQTEFAALLQNLPKLPKELIEREHDCMKSLCVALQSLHWGKDFRLTLSKVIMNGGDCKVAATVVGAIHGALGGYSSLPRNWLTQLLPKQTHWLDIKVNHLLDLMAIP